MLEQKSCVKSVKSTLLCVYEFFVFKAVVIALSIVRKAWTPNSEPTVKQRDNYVTDCLVQFILLVSREGG